MQRINVAAAIIWNTGRDALLLSQRPLNKHLGGLWEFPGGKVEGEETAEQALQRELFEELNIQVEELSFYQQVDFNYPDKNVSLQFYHAYNIQGEISAKEGQQWRWVKRESLKDYQFPAANQGIVDHLVCNKA